MRMLREDFLEEVTLESSPEGPGAAGKDDRGAEVHRSEETRSIWETRGKAPG